MITCSIHRHSDKNIFNVIYRDRVVPVLDTIVPAESNKPYDIIDIVEAVII